MRDGLERPCNLLRRYPHLPALLLIPLTAGLLPLIGSGCLSCSKLDDKKDVSPKSVNVSASSGHRSASAGGAVSRELVLTRAAGATIEKTDVDWWPPQGATGLTFPSGQPENPAGPAPYRFKDVAVLAAGATEPSLRVAYQPPASGGVHDDFIATDADGRRIWFAFDGAAAAASAQPAALGAETTAAAPYAAWQAQFWGYTHDDPLSEQECRDFLGRLGSDKVFAAIHFPTQGRGTDSAHEVPLVLGGSQAPRLQLLDYTKPAASQAVLDLELQPAPERMGFVTGTLPRVAGQGWAVVKPVVAAGTACPQGVTIPANQWEVHEDGLIDYGSSLACDGCTLEFYLCYEGQSDPFLGGSAAALAARLASVQADGITCIGPAPIRISSDETPPGLDFDGPSASRVTPPGQARSLHLLQNESSSSQSVTFSSSSGLGLDWKLYRGSHEVPDLNQPITGSVAVQGHNVATIWSVADIPAGTQGIELHTLRATAAGHPSLPVWTVDHVLVGPWVPPPPPAQDVTVWVPVASHNSGSNQSQWRTDLGILNPTDEAVTVQLTLHVGATVTTRSETVAAREQAILTDVVALIQPGFLGSGSLEVTSPRAVKVSSRTYNLVAGTAACYPNGTFGQGYDAYRTEDGVAAGETAYLPQLVETTQYRTNIALTNTGTATARATVTLLNGAGGSIGSYNVTLLPGEWKQENRPFFAKGGQSNLTRGSARVAVTEGAGVIACASVVDNTTNDPTTLAMVREAGARTSSWLQVGSHAGGSNQSQWRTDLGVLNRTAATANLQIKLRTGTTTQTATTTVAAGAQAILVDVVGQIPYTGSGSLEVVSDQPVNVSSRTYNLVAPTATCHPNGTFGQSYDALASTQGLVAGESAYLTQLTENAAFRTNIALTNTGTTPAVVSVELYNAAGTLLKTYTVNLNPGEYKQDNRPFNAKAGQSSLARGYARVTVTSGSGVIASASVLDNATNDPTTLPMLR